ncbi:MAG: putative PurR-regulated permease PerM [Glaciihabitans sp.]|nr:putative PurR-regulated permease PerM [Glaciihabitans sp.]
MKIHNAFRLGLLGGLGVLVAVAIGAAVASLATILTYIGAALFLALGFDPLVTWLQNKGMKRAIAILIVVVGILGVVTGLVFALVPIISDQIAALVEAIPNLIRIYSDGTLYAAISEALPWLQIDDLRDQLLTSVQSPTFISSLGGGVLQAGISIATGITGTIIVLILMLYFIASLGSLKRGLYKLVPASRRSGFVRIAEQIAQSVGRYVIGQVTLALFNGVLSFFFLNFFVKADYAVLLAFIAFLGSLIPLVGTVSASVVITLAVLLFNGPPSVFWVAGYYLVYMQVEAYILSPRIMNRAVEVPGVVVVIAALAGGTLLGILGALVAIPVAASILIVITQVVMPRQNEL